MNNILSSIGIIACMLFTVNLPAQEKQELKPIETAEFSVTGVCGMCEDRIENAALDNKGVKLAEWDIEKQMLKVMYKTDKVDLKTIQQSIANVGHDTEMFEAESSAYEKLPACCAYKDGVTPHK